MTERVTWLRHNRVDLALHHLRDAADPTVRPLLLLHGLGECAPREVPDWVDWAGSVHALDFTGHGASTVPAGGGYQSEMLLGDADHALAHLTGDVYDSITVVGRGLGAYVALQLAGGRASNVHGAILLDGPGLAGGATGPSSMSYTHVPDEDLGRAPDPYALIELSRELRPADYATSFVRLANAGSPSPTPIVVCSTFRPRWLAAVADTPGVVDTSIAEAFRLLR